MGKLPTGPEGEPSAESPLQKELGRLARLSGFLRIGEKPPFPLLLLKVKTIAKPCNA